MGKGNLSQRCFSAHHTRGSVDKQDETKGKELVEQIEREYASQQEKQQYEDWRRSLLIEKVEAETQTGDDTPVVYKESMVLDTEN